MSTHEMDNEAVSHEARDLQISICISTYQRPEGLRRLLDGLDRLTFTQISPPAIEVIVVDNDASRSANEFCENRKHSFKWSLKYDHELQQGVSYTRNRTIANTSEDSDFIVIIDDDEVPVAEWLEELLLTQQQYNADVVSGPVLAHFEGDNVPQWIEQGKFFEPHRYPTGQPINVAFTNNVLIRSSILKGLEQVFDERLAIKGAEDTYLFMRLRKDGYHIVWSDEAIVYEWIPQSRTNLKWLLQRGYWGWSSYSLFEKELYPSLYLQTLRFIKGCGLIVAGALALIPSAFKGKYKLSQALLNLYRGAGTLSGLLGFQGEWLNAEETSGLLSYILTLRTLVSRAKLWALKLSPLNVKATRGI